MATASTSVGEYCESLAGKEPVPGGGGASALAGALAAALGSMVANLTIGKKKYAEVEAEITARREQCDALRLQLLALADADEQVFLPLAGAYGLPAETDEQRAHKDAVMATVLADACTVPMDILSACDAVIGHIEVLAEKGSVMAVSDAAAAAALCAGAAKAASLNIFINTKTMKDRGAAQAFNARADALLASVVPRADRVFADVRARLRPALEV